MDSIRKHIKFIDGIGDKRSYYSSIQSQIYLDVLMTELMLDQLHDFTEGSRSSTSNKKVFNNDDKKTISKKIIETYIGNIKTVKIKSDMEDEYKKGLSSFFNNKYILSEYLINQLDINMIDFEDIIYDSPDLNNMYSCSDIVDTLKYFNDYIAKVDNNNENQKYYFLFIDAYKSNIRISPILYNICDIVFNPNRDVVHAGLVKTIGTFYDASTTSSAEKYIKRLQNYKKNKEAELKEKNDKKSKNELKSLRKKKIRVNEFEGIREGEDTYKKYYNILHGDKEFIRFSLMYERADVIIKLDDKMKENFKDFTTNTWRYRTDIYNFFMGKLKDKFNVDDLVSLNEKLKPSKCITKIKFGTKKMYDMDAVDKKYKNKKDRREYEIEKGKVEENIKKRDETIDIWLKHFRGMDYEISDKEKKLKVKPSIEKWCYLDSKKLQDAGEELYKNLPQLSVDNIVDYIIKNKKIDDAIYYFPYKTIGDFSQILDCYFFSSLNNKKVNTFFLTFDRMCSFISSMFNRTILETQGDDTIVSLNTFKYIGDDFTKKLSEIKIKPKISVAIPPPQPPQFDNFPGYITPRRGEFSVMNNLMDSASRSVLGSRSQGVYSQESSPFSFSAQTTPSRSSSRPSSRPVTPALQAMTPASQAVTPESQVLLSQQSDTKDSQIVSVDFEDGNEVFKTSFETDIPRYVPKEPVYGSSSSSSSSSRVPPNRLPRTVRDTPPGKKRRKSSRKLSEEFE